MKTSATADTGKPDSSPTLGRSAARLAAVQALYQVASTDSDYTKVVQDFLAGHLGGVAIDEDPDTKTEIPVRLADMDQGMFSALVSVARARQDDIDGMIDTSLSSDWPKERLEMVVRSILRIAVAELLGAADVPVKVTISEYVDITHAFYAGPEPGMVNAVLYKIAGTVRQHDLAAS